MTSATRGKDWEAGARQVRTLIENRREETEAAADLIAPGLRDQLEAASRDARRQQDKLRDHEPGRYGSVDIASVPEQIGDQVFGLYIRVVTEMASGARRKCPHLSVQAPRAAFAPVYDDWISCTACLSQFEREAPLTEEESRTCDLCGGYQPGQQLNALYPQIGPVLMAVGVCPACASQLGIGREQA